MRSRTDQLLAVVGTTEIDVVQCGLVVHIETVTDALEPLRAKGTLCVNVNHFAARVVDLLGWHLSRDALRQLMQGWCFGLCSCVCVCVCVCACVCVCVCVFGGGRDLQSVWLFVVFAHQCHAQL